MSDVAWSRPEYRVLAEFIEARAGLVFSEPRRRDVEATFARYAEQAGARGHALVAHLRADAALRDALVAELTIGETYFFRDRAQFEVLERTVLPALPATRRAEGLRFWSAGCASGEEPYSLGILLDRSGLRERACVIGTDIARPRLESAQRALYPAWSLRGVSAAERARYFTAAGKFFRLKPRYRQHVEFRYLNLAEDSFPGLESGIWGMDVILCRNVLIYFDAETVRAVAERLIAALGPDGWLLLGATDPPLGELVRCEVVTTEAGLVYRRASARALALGPLGRPLPDRVQAPAVLPASPAPPQPPQPEPPAAAETGAAAAPRARAADLPVEPAAGSETSPSGADARARARAAYARTDYDEVVEIVATTSDADAELVALQVRALANQGRLEEAGQVARVALDEHRLDTELLYLNALLLGEAQHPEAAIAMLRQALYLDRTLVMAHLTLARLLGRTHQKTGAARALRNARDLLAGMDPEAAVRLGDGETAARLRVLAEAQLRLLEAA